MSVKVKRKVTVENSKENSDHPKRPSVFERLGPGAVNVSSQSQERAGRIDQNEKCRNWLRAGTCAYGNTCRFQHDLPVTSSKRPKNEKNVEEKDFRRKMKNNKRDETKDSKTGSISPKRKDKKRRSRSQTRKGEHESKIKSTVVVTRPRSPTSGPQIESIEKDKKKTEGSWEDDSDDWPIDAAQLDYKEELTLERKRQQLKRELELELQKERLMNQNRSVSESSSSSSSSDSGSISSSSDSSSSSSDEDSDESSSSTSSTSSSASRTPVKRKSKKPQAKKEPARESTHKKPIDDYDKIKNSRAQKSGWRPRSPSSPEIIPKKTHDRKKGSPSSSFSPKRYGGHEVAKGAPLQGGRKGPRTPSPAPIVSKQRHWAQSSSADSRSADTRRNRSKRHKKKKDVSRTDRNRMEYVPTPPPLSSPNRTALQPHVGKKSRHRDDSGLRGHHKNQEQSPILLSRVTQSSNSPSLRHGSHYSEMDRFSDKQNQPKSRTRKMDDISQSHRENSKERPSKHSRMSSPNKDSRRLSMSPVYDKYDNDSLSKGMYSPPMSRIDRDDNRRRNSLSPMRKGKDIKGRQKGQGEFEKRRDNRDFSPRSHDSRRDTQYKGNESHRKDDKENKKRDDKIKDRGQKERNLEHDSWSDEPKKGLRASDSRRIVEPVLPQSGRGDRSRDRKNKKDHDPVSRPEDIERDRQRLSPTVSLVPSELHHGIRDDIPRGRIYESEIPSESRDYAYGYVPPRDAVYLDEPPLQPDYESDLRVAPLYHPPTDPVDYPPPTYPEPRYRRDPTLKAVTPVPHIDRITGYSTRDISPLGPRDPVGLPVRDDDYLSDLPIGDRPYDERWGRNRTVRDDWDAYPPLASEGLPAHVVASGLDEDRYGMPRRRRASPDSWIVRRGDDRDISLREPRSRSPPPHRRVDDLASTSRGSWGNDHHNNRNNDLRQDNQQKSGLHKRHVKKLPKNDGSLCNFVKEKKNQDDRKNRNNRRDRRDRGKRNDEQLNETKPVISKEKTNAKRPHSISPNRKDSKKRKDDVPASESAASEKSSTLKKVKEESKPEFKTNLGSRKRSKGVGEDEFSDWSEGDDDLLNRDDFIESESNSGDRTIPKNDNNKKEKSSKPTDSTNKESNRRPKRESSKDSWTKTKDSKTESHARTSSKERYDPRDFERLLNYSRKSIDGSDRNRIQPVGSKVIISEVKTVKLGPIHITKEKSPVDVGPMKKEVDTDKFAVSENDEFDPISDEEFEALIEEPDEAVMKTNENGEMKIVDALDINWSTLMNETKAELLPSKARNRFKAVHVLSRIGFSQSLAGSALSEKIMEFCQKQLDEEKEEENSPTKDSIKSKKKFIMEHPIASFHVSLMQKKKERREIFDRIGASRRALCARQDLYIRKLLCRPINNLIIPTPTSCTQQYSNAETEQSGRSPQTISCS